MLQVFELDDSLAIITIDYLKVFSICTGFIRFGTAPNLRSQDGQKGHYLCDSCEQLFNSWETDFANLVFHPLNEGGAHSFNYGPWMLKFAVSVSWRVLTYFINKNWFFL